MEQVLRTVIFVLFLALLGVIGSQLDLPYPGPDDIQVERTHVNH